MSLIKAAHLTRKAVFEVSGPDAQKFLKGQTCKDVEKMGGGYSGLLNASGRVIHTVFILPLAPDRYLITSDARNPFPLTKLLPPFRLRSKVRFMDATAEWDAYATWGQAPVGEAQLASRWKLGSGGAAERSWSWQQRQVKGKGKADADADADAASVGIVKSREKGEGVGCWDLRAGDQGMQHVLIPKGQLPDAEIVPEDAYNLRRMLMGLPEGPEELQPGAALPLESCMDIHGGVDFRKGCYLGQELTVRTYHTGATRKRILPLHFFPLSDPALSLSNLPVPSLLSSSASTTTVPTSPGSNIIFHPGPASVEGGESTTSSAATSTRPKAAGKILSQLSNVGLGMVRLEMADRSWWARQPQPQTVGEYMRGPRLTAELGGEQWGVKVGMGEAYGQMLEAALGAEDR